MSASVVEQVAEAEVAAVAEEVADVNPERTDPLIGYVGESQQVHELMENVKNVIAALNNGQPGGRAQASATGRSALE